MKKLLDREPTPEMVNAVAKALMTPTDRWASDVCAAVFDAATALPEPGEVERRLREAGHWPEFRAMGIHGHHCIEAADLIAALQFQRESEGPLIESLRHRAEKAEAILNDDGPEGHKVSNAQHVALRAENERLRKDAERYRWIRDKWLLGHAEWPRTFTNDDNADDIDAAIDAAKGKP